MIPAPLGSAASEEIASGEKAADVVIFIYHKMDDIKKMIELSELIIEKHRNGPTGTIPIIFKSTLTKFLNAVTMSTPL